MEESEDSRRKKFFQDKLLDKLASSAPQTKSKIARTPQQLESLPLSQALSYLYHSSEALDALTQRNNIIREDGNFVAHNMLSLQRFSVQVEEGKTHLKGDALQAMRVLIQVCTIVDDKIPITKESPPAGGSTLGEALGPIAQSTSTKTASPSSPPPAPHSVSVPPSSSRPTPTSPASPSSGTRNEPGPLSKAPASAPGSKKQGSGKKPRPGKGK